MADKPTTSSAAEFALQALVAAGHVSQELVDKAMALPGAPQPAHSGEPVAWRYRMSGDMQWQYTERKEQFSHASEVEALTNMQPVERELLTPEQRDALWESCKYDDGEEWTVDWEQIVDAVERHHRIGIKGGQHGVDT